MLRIRMAGWSGWHLFRAAVVFVAAVGSGVVIGLALAPVTASAQAVKTFEAPAGMIFNFVESGSTADFEQVMTRVGSVMLESDNPERVNQARGWKVYKALEPGPNGDVLYVWLIDPTIPEVDYSVAQILNEEIPNEVQ